MVVQGICGDGLFLDHESNSVLKIFDPPVMLGFLPVVVLSVDVYLELVVSEEILECLNEITNWGSNSQLKFKEGSGYLAPFRVLELLHLGLKLHISLGISFDTKCYSKSGKEKDCCVFHFSFLG